MKFHSFSRLYLLLTLKAMVYTQLSNGRFDKKNDRRYNELEFNLRGHLIGYTSSDKVCI